MDTIIWSLRLHLLVFIWKELDVAYIALGTGHRFIAATLESRYA